MYKATEKTLSEAYKPYDVVSDKDGNVGFIEEVSVNECQPEPHQISYSVKWLIGSAKTAWWDHKHLTKHCNIFVKIAECSCHNSGHGSYDVKRLMANGI